MTSKQNKPKPLGDSASTLNRIADLAVALLLLLLCLAFFFKTACGTGSISRLCVLAEWDSVFDAFRTGKAQAYDPSLVQIFLPDYVFLAQNLTRGILPLWNPHCGLGYPFLADIQSSVFAPLRIIFDFAPSLKSYNCYLLLEIAFCLLSSFFLARALKLSRFAAALAAFAFTFCPYNLWYLELNLGSSACLFPLTTLAFLEAAGKKTLGTAFLAGLASGLLILTGHPECSFFGIVLSTLLCLVYILLNSNDSLYQKLFSWIKITGLAALVTVAISAPVLFPFGEYLMNAESYKYGSAYSTPVTWNGIIFNLLNPGQNGASPFLGIIVLLLIPLSCLSLRKHSHTRSENTTLIILTLATFILVSQLGPVQALFSKAPLTAIITRYALPYLLMLLSLLGGSGLDQLERLCRPNAGVSRSFHIFGKYFTLLCLGVLPILYFSFSQNVAQIPAFMKAADFDAMLPATELNDAAWRRDIICTLLFLGVAVTSIFKPAEQFKHAGIKLKERFGSSVLLIAGALLLGFISLANVSKASLPLQSHFFYPDTEITEKLKDSPYRVISTCEHVLRPATNSVYGINFLTVHNPLFPSRFLSFLKASGADTDIFNQKFSNKISKLLNLASVKYVLSLDAPIDPSGNEDRFRLVFTSKNLIHIYENMEAAPRAYLVNKAQFIESSEMALQKLQEADFEPSQTVLIEKSEQSKSDLENTVARQDQTVRYPQTEAYQSVDSIKTENPNKVEIACKTDKKAWLVLTDVYYPGWKVYIDSRQAQIERANFAFRAVKLDAGEHQVDFVYEPHWFILGCASFAVALLVLIAALRTKLWKYEL